MKKVCALLALMMIALESGAQSTVHVAVVMDGSQFEFAGVAQIFREELVALTEGEFDVVYKEFSGTWTEDSVRQAYADAFSDPEVDLVLGLGVAGNQIIVASEEFPKPTFLPLVFDARLMGAPGDGSRSGKKNLNYLAERVSLIEELKTYRRVIPFTRATVLVDQLILDSIPQLSAATQQAAREAGIALSLLGHDGMNHDLAPEIPAGAEAVLYAAMPRMPPQQLSMLIESVTLRRLPLFSLSESALVDRGMLAADTVDTDWQRLARRNALNMQAVLLGEAASDQPVFFRGKQELIINMETARRIGLSPRFDVLAEARLLNDNPPQVGPEFDLEGVALAALTANLSLRGEELGADASAQNISVARSALLPQVGLGAQQTRRKITPTVQAGGIPEQSSDASLTLSQTLYSDDIYADLDIRRSSQIAVEAGLDATRLDVIRDAALAYLEVLQAENQLAIQKDNLDLTKSNLDLARDRVRIGTSTDTDVYRWQSNLAIARGDLIRSRERVSQAREALNLILNQPINNPIRLKPAGDQDAFAISSDRFDQIVNNPRAFGWVTDLVVQRGQMFAPELKQLDAQILAKQREITNRKRDYWLPDFSLESQYADNLSQSGVGAGGLADEERDWTVSLKATLPIFNGGRRKSELSRSRFELRQLEVQREAIAERVEQQVRSAMHELYGSYANIRLAGEAAAAASKTLELVTDAYAQGTLGILDVLDAQSQSLSAELSAKNSVYVFLGDAIRLQRATSQFDFLFSAEEAAANRKELEDYLSSRRLETVPSNAVPQ